MKYNDKNQKVLLIIVIILLCLLFLILGWYILFKKNDNKSLNTPDITEVIKEVVEPPVPENIEIDKVKANEELKKFALMLEYANLSNDTKLIGDDKLNNSELLDLTTKLRFTYYDIVTNQLDNNKVIANVSPTGEQIIGMYAVDLTYFNEYYSNLFNETLDDNVDYLVIRNDATIIDNYIYASIPSIWERQQTALKFNNLTKEEDIYTLEIDALYFEDINEVLYNEEVKKYFDSGTIIYNENLIDYKIKIKYELIDQKYIVKSIVAC